MALGARVRGPREVFLRAIVSRARRKIRYSPENETARFPRWGQTTQLSSRGSRTAASLGTARAARRKRTRPRRSRGARWVWERCRSASRSDRRLTVTIFREPISPQGSVEAGGWIPVFARAAKENGDRGTYRPRVQTRNRTGGRISGTPPVSARPLVRSRSPVSLPYRQDPSTRREFGSVPRVSNRSRRRRDRPSSRPGRTRARARARGRASRRSRGERRAGQ
jgi:hypothetical protein